MIQQVDNGTQVASVSTEHTLSTRTAARTYVLLVDLSNLAAGDTVEIRAKLKVLSGSSVRQAYVETFTGEQVDDVFVSIPIPTAHSCSFTLKQTAGTGRSFDWGVLSLD